MTLDKEKEFVDLLTEKIKEQMEQYVQVIASSDFTEERGENVVVVGINNSTQVNVGLPDYEYSVQVIVDCFIDGDKQAYKFNQIKGKVLDYLEPYLMDRRRLPELFEDIPVVGFFFEGVSNNVTQESNKCIIGLRAIVSYPIL